MSSTARVLVGLLAGLVLGAGLAAGAPLAASPIGAVCALVTAAICRSCSRWTIPGLFRAPGNATAI